MHHHSVAILALLGGVAVGYLFATSVLATAPSVRGLIFTTPRAV
jgi:hypothetical protein